MSGLDRKYVVFKADEFDAWIQDYLTPLESSLRLPLPMPGTVDDAIVLRKQDIFTSSALYEYAGQIRTTIELMRKIMEDTRNGESLPEILARLQVMADQFADEAESAETEFTRKIPD